MPPSRRSATNNRPKSLALVVVLALIACACSVVPVSDPSPQIGAVDADCRSFGGETVQAVAWASAGDFLAVSTSVDADGEGRIRVYTWPTMDKVSEATTDVLAVDDAAIDDHGSVYWFSWDPFSNAPASTRLWKLDPGGTPTMIGGAVRDGAYVGLIWAGGGLVSMRADLGPPERSRIVKIDIDRPEAEPEGLTPWTTRLWSSFWVDRSGGWIVRDEYDDAGEPQDFVVLHDGRRQVVRPPGYGGGQMTLTPDHAKLVYQRSETARLTVLDLKSGQIDGELSAVEVYGGEVSSTGILAMLTAHGPGEPNEFCVLDVRADL